MMIETKTTSQGIRVRAVSDDGTILADRLCRSPHPVALSRVKAAVHERAVARLRLMKLEQRIREQDYTLPDLRSAYTGPYTVAVRSGRHDPPEGWVHYAYAYPLTPAEIEARGLPITELGAYTRRIVAEHNAGLSVHTLIRAPEGTGVPEGWERIDRDDPRWSPYDGAWTDPIEHRADVYREALVQDFLRDTRTRYAWVRPSGTRWICGVGVGSHTYQAPGTFPDPETAARYVLDFWRADLVERVWELREELIGCELDLPTRPRLIVAPDRGNLWSYTDRDHLRDHLRGQIPEILPPEEWSPGRATRDGRPAWQVLREVIHAAGWT